MISVTEAIQKCLSAAKPLPVERLPLDDVLGLVLAEDVSSDVDSPPFDKALMDGFAVRGAEVQPGAGLLITEEITAGQVPKLPVEPGTAARIMTGAPLPAGADAVVRMEDADWQDGQSRVRFQVSRISPGENVMRRGAAMQRGETVLSAGRVLRPQELGVLAELGNAFVPVRRRPRVAVLATGDELVPVDQPPKPGQIRNSNETMLAAQITRAEGVAERLGIARDERSHLAEKIQAGLNCDLLILSGGVSAGMRDFVPSELAAAGVLEIFHGVHVKPGKPVWFGLWERQSSKDGENAAGRCYVFGLPGNPVSSMVCFEAFARPVIRRLLGFSSAEPESVSATLQADYHLRGERPVYHPAELNWSATGPMVRLVPWLGSADLRATVNANAMAVFPVGDTTYSAGTKVEVIPWV